MKGMKEVGRKTLHKNGRRGKRKRGEEGGWKKREERKVGSVVYKRF